MRKIIILSTSSILSFVISIESRSQDIATDNEGKPIFTVPNTKKLTTDIALNNLGLDYTPFHLKRVKYFITDENGQKKYTMYKSTTINLKGNIVNNDEDVLLFGKDMDITPHIEIGINRAIDTLINPSRIGKYYTFSAALFADFQSFDLYDTTNKKFLTDKYSRTSYGGRVSLNIFFRTSSALALNLSYKNSIVTDDLTSFQKRSSNEIYVDNNIATNGEVDGYLTPLTPSKNWRFSIAYPQFLKGSLHLAIIPYYFVKFGESIKPKNNAGIMFTFLNDTFRNFDKKKDGQYDQDARYTFESAFSIGLNLLSTGSDKRNYVFLSGTVSFGKTKAQKEKEPQSPTFNNLF
jgi:hypothetical protein